MSTMPTNIVRPGEPSRSALAVASLRAVHQLLDEPLVLPDPIALPLLGAAIEAALRNDPFVLNDPMSRGLRGAVVVRKPAVVVKPAVVCRTVVVNGVKVRRCT